MQPWQRLEYIMQYYGLTKNSLSVEIGLKNNATITRLINEKRTPSKRTYDLILKRFSAINEDWLKFGRGEPISTLNSHTGLNFVKTPIVKDYTTNTITDYILIKENKSITAKIQAFEINDNAMAPEFRLHDVILATEQRFKTKIENGNYFIYHKENGYVFRNIEIKQQKVICRPLNTDYANQEYQLKDIEKFYKPIELISRII